MKTYKREMAGLLVLGEIILAALWANGNDHAAAAAKYFGDFVFPFTAYAFGLDWWSKQKPQGDTQ